MSKKVKIRAVPCEVWSRVVGYYRPVKGWNEGKQEEFKDRKTLAWKPEGPIKDLRWESTEEG